MSAPPWVGTKVTVQKVQLLADGKKGEIPHSVHMQMRAGAGDPLPKPPSTTLQQGWGFSRLPPPRPTTWQIAPRKPVLHPRDVLVTGHSCVPRAALTAHSPSSGGCAHVPLDRHPFLTDPCSGAREACAAATYTRSQGPGVSCGAVHILLLRPRKWGQDCAMVLGGRSCGRRQAPV